MPKRSRHDAGNAAGRILGRRVHGGVPMGASRPSPMAESESDGSHPDVAARHAPHEPATMIKRLRGVWVQRRREQTEFKAWLEITAKPLW